MTTRILTASAVLGLVLSLACGPVKLGEDSADDGTGGGDTETGGGDTEETGDPLAGQRPEVTGVELVSCTPNTDSQDTWIVSCYADDPQGIDTLGFGYVEIRRQGEALGSQHPMVCNGEGKCSASWEAESEEPCSVKGATVAIVAVDEDGNESAAYEYSYTP
jgi:hypothetical protein